MVINFEINQDFNPQNSNIIKKNRHTTQLSSCRGNIVNDGRHSGNVLGSFLYICDYAMHIMYSLILFEFSGVSPKLTILGMGLVVGYLTYEPK